MAGGLMCRSLDIDLTTGEVRDLEIRDEDHRLYLGGKGMGARLLYDHTPAGLDAYAPEMALIFTTGPVTGSGAPQSNRFVVTTRSPLTDCIASSTCGGDFATKLKKAGIDHLLVRGRAESPVYIEIVDGEVAIKDATHLWGKGTRETQELLPKKLGKAVIGQAGENLVRYASVVSQERVAGRTGCGAVMGSKNLKAIVAGGTAKLPIDDKDAFKKRQKSHTKFLLGHPMTGDILPKLGTANIVNTASGRNILPVRNFSVGMDLEAPQISGELLADKHLSKRVGCLACPIICGRGIELEAMEAGVEVGEGAAPQLDESGAPVKRKKTPVTKGPEYETIALIGSNIGCFDIKRVSEWNHLCDDYGMDTISTGGTIGFAMELTSKGMLDSDLSFDEHESISALLGDIAHRRGLGDDLAEGTRRMSEKYGGTEFAIQVKGLELPAYDPRGCYGQGLEYATTGRGGCHVQGSLMYLEAIGPVSLGPRSVGAKPQLVMLQQNIWAAVSSSVFCIFSTYGLMPSLAFRLKPQGLPYRFIGWAAVNSGPILSVAFKTKVPFAVYWYEKFLREITGLKLSFGDFVEIGERAFNMQRLYNLREGMTAAADTLPPRLLNESIDAGIEGGVPLDRMLPKYYKLRGWDSSGVPKPKTLKRLSIRT